MRTWRALLLACLVALPQPSAWAAKPDVIASFVAYEPAVAVDSTGNVVVELRGLWGSPNDLPRDFAFSDADLVAARIGYRQAMRLPPDAIVLRDAESWFPKNADGVRWINPFMAPNGRSGLFAFQVTIRNRGSVPVRLDVDSITLSTGGSPEAVHPSSDLVSYDRWILGQEVAMDRDRSGPLALIQKGYTLRHVPYPVGIARAILAQKLPGCCGSLFGRTVVPGATASGYLQFPVEWGTDSLTVSIRIAGSREAETLRFRRADRTCRWDGGRNRWTSMDAVVR